ncbi:uncharacterized protein [Spinacia oleracea]|uniref:Reverse transcriptase zinc-binding domain-containing protein n=1 Tax=Spinacia oleracea TaxID=3562 RepID=A0ABM3RP08_SPIOL|nr:uncharacterized protein LOC130471324 [Spinacia oleracea]
MPPPKNLLHFMPLPGQKLKSVVVAEPPPVDQPLIEEDIIPSPLKPSAASGIEIQDITEVMEAIEADFVPGLVVPEVAEEKESADLPFEREKSPDKEMIDLSGPEAAVPEAQKEVPSAGEEEQPEQGLTRKRRHSTLGSTSTSALDRLIHADPCSDVPLKRIPEEVREAMARYARAPILGEDPLAHVGSLVGPEAARENLLRANPQWRVPGAEERNPAMMAQYYLNEAVFWSSFASECSSVEEKQLRKYREAYARDIPILDQKAGQLLSELTELKQLYLHYTREARESAEKIGTEVGQLIFRVEEDAEKIASFAEEKKDMAAKFASELEEKDRLFQEMKSKFEAADKEHKEAELRLHHFVQHRELIQQQADKVPVLRLKLREKDDYIRKLEQERVNLYTADQLPTRDMLVAWKVTTMDECPFCNTKKETVAHLFFECHYSAAVWNVILHSLKFNRRAVSFDQELTWVLKATKRTGDRFKLLVMYFAECIYSIWFQKNEMVFNHRCRSPADIVSDIKFRVACRATAGQHRERNLIGPEQLYLLFHEQWANLLKKTFYQPNLPYINVMNSKSLRFFVTRIIIFAVLQKFA